MNVDVITFAVVFNALAVAHKLGDHWLQTTHQSATKGRRDAEGVRACLAHVATYTAGTAAFVGLVWWMFGLPITPLGFILGQLVSAITHYWADRRFTLGRLAELTGHGPFYRLGMPRAGHDDNPTLGGAYALDQSFHAVWLFVAALLTAVTA